MKRSSSGGLAAAVLGLLGLVLIGLNYLAGQPMPVHP